MARKIIGTFLFLCLFVGLSGCWRSEEEVDMLTEDSYNQGWYDALDCVKKKGGSAYDAAEDCEDE
jgi:hypothetical protein